ncbi:MAG: ABC transporter permease, partial [Candidatus Omnitrophica bacterium]|nr:ABC transporter permease [Candidatus Omnitrophota bacterium]
MRILEDLLAGCEGLARNKMRSMLSALGIVIAVGSVVMIVTLGDQAKKLIILELERRWGADLVIIENAPPQRYRHWLDDWKNLKDEDLAAVRRKIDYVEFIGGLRESRSKQVVYGSEHVMGNLKEVDPDYLEARGRIVREGRNLTWSDQENALKVCTIGAELAQELFDTEENAINQEVRITGQRFKVIGVVDPKAEQVGNSEFAKDIYIPLSTGGRRFSGDDPLDEIVIKTHGSYNTERVLTEVADIL